MSFGVLVPPTIICSPQIREPSPSEAPLSEAFFSGALITSISLVFFGKRQGSVDVYEIFCTLHPFSSFVLVLFPLACRLTREQAEAIEDEHVFFHGTSISAADIFFFEHLVRVPAT